jgi:hypothetical protein
VTDHLVDKFSNVNPAAVQRLGGFFDGLRRFMDA